MDRNDIQCQICGRYIFNGLQYWCVEYAAECKTAKSEPDSNKLHVLTYYSRRDNGYMLCPTCATKHENKCPVCDKPLTIKPAWMSSIPIVVNGEPIEVKFTYIPSKVPFSSPTRFNVTVGEAKTDYTIDFHTSDAGIDTIINEVVLSIFGKGKWRYY